MTLAELENQAIASEKAKYAYISDADMHKAFNYALADYLLYKYPVDKSRPLADKLEITFVIEQWIEQRMEDILSRGGGTNVTAYKENGISWTYASSHIDSALASMITPKASTPK